MMRFLSHPYEPRVGDDVWYYATPSDVQVDKRPNIGQAEPAPAKITALRTTESGRTVDLTVFLPGRIEYLALVHYASEIARSKKLGLSGRWSERGDLSYTDFSPWFS